MTRGFILAFIQFVLLQVTLMEPTEVTGYIGQSITLKTGESPSSQLTQVEWSIFKNTTIIAKLKDGSQSLNRFWRYKGRLQLDHTTGDLFIKKLIQGDNLTYSVELKNGDKRKTHKIILKLREPRSKPEINITYSMLKANQCVIMLRCSSTEEDVQFYWNAMDNFVEPYWSGTSNQNSNESALWTSFSPNRNVTFTCAIRNEDSVSSDLTVKCLECRQRLIPENLRQLRN
ncbi:uncharacterized protein LOC115816409 [Chanos chanos]|uniref:Uncharacterized protein LOC115816409 n=1 Tax=Chanos chanos TaxID=29144 RepID=A0A6J2VU13_CHACN|nr:uncharacterized protein LOC115816409 [Chanos chanos]